MTHVVQSGENLTIIANLHNTTVSRISAENHISAQATLRVGQVLSITQAEPEAPAAAPTSTPQPAAPPPTESPADSDPAPAQDSDSPAPPPISQPEATATPTSPPAATAVPIPQSCAGYAQAGEVRYTVRGGDNLSRLATQYNTSVTVIKRRNCLNSDSLMVGQLLIIPIGSGTPIMATPTSAGSGPDPTSTRAPATATPTRWPTSTPRPTPSPTPVPIPTATPSGSWLDRLLGRTG